MVGRLEDLPALLKPSQVASVLQVTPKNVRELILAGKLRATNIGIGKERANYRVLKDDLLSFIHGDVEQGRNQDKTTSVERKAA